jgi:hypothetical protein
VKASHLLDIYDVRINLATTARDWSSLRRKLTFLPDRPNSLGSSSFAVWTPKKDGPPEPHLVLWLDMARLDDVADLVDTIAHEAAHGAGQILDWVGHDIRGIDEPHAYLVGWLTRWMYTTVTQPATS